ncbi:MAG: hypothetical protein WC321_03130 [Candidatus Omnitrophota bacterium]|jgi:hypothetical protein
MKKCAALLLSVIFLSGCAAYKFQRGESPYDKGYVVSRDDYTIVEYTIGQDNSVPDRKLARERFLRRRKIVEDYYKRMGYIESRFKMAFIDPPIILIKLMSGVFRLPCAAVSDYRYEHNPAYREKIKKLEDASDAREEARIKKFQEGLNRYIQEDLSRERP